MKKYLLLFLVLALNCVWAQSSTNQNKIFKLKRAPGPIKIDGIIDPAWNQADSVSDFNQFFPYYGKNPSHKTTVKLLTSENSIFVLFICYDEHENLSLSTGLQDNFNGDAVAFMIDTFNDQKTAYKFIVGASGARADCRLLDDYRNRDFNWDGIWFSSSRVYDWGYVVEMEIPYKSIQYDEKLTYWGLDFNRGRLINSEDISWCNYVQSEGPRISKFGKLVFEDFKPTVKGLNLEIYPVGLTKVEYNTESEKYKFKPTAGLDVFYNPSPKLTLQATVNPDFAQIEADPYNFNISRYETYYSERRPFFTQGNEIFMASGKENNSGFYQPLELFYWRRIGKKLSDGTEVPLNYGAKVFGRLDDFEYGGFVAQTSAADYESNGHTVTEPAAVFESARVKKQIFGNSSIGALFVGKQTATQTYGVVDIDGAFRGSDWQLSYQLANAFNHDSSDFAASYGYRKTSDDYMILSRGRYVGNKFDVSQIGYVPWTGTISELTFGGPRWHFSEGYINEILILVGGAFTYKHVEAYTDNAFVFCMDMNFRDNWGYEIDFDLGKCKDSGIIYDNWDLSFSSWYNISPKWNADFQCGYSKTYNFPRNYLGGYGYVSGDFSWKASKIFEIGTSFSSYIELNPANNIDEVTYDARPYFSFTPLNDCNIRMYADNLFLRSTDRMEQIIVGFLFSYQFSPKSWIYLAVNEIHDRSPQYMNGIQISNDTMNIRERAGVFKIKYLYYF